MDSKIGTIVLVADTFEHDSENVTFNARTLEKPSSDSCKYLINTVRILTFVHPQKI